MIKLGMPQLLEYDTLEGNFALAKELGLDFVELNLNFSSCREGLEHQKIESLLNKYNMDVTLHFFDEADFGSYEEVVDAYLLLLRRYAGYGKVFIKQINVHLCPGPVVTISGIKHYVYDKEYALYRDRLLNSLSKARKICEDFGMNLVIENTDNTPPFLLKAYEDMDKHGFRFCFDIGHDHLSDDVLYDYQKEHPLPFDEFHIHDGKDRRKCHLTLGEGEIDVSKFKRLAECNDAYVVLEVKQSEDLIASVPLFRAI